MTTFIDTNVLVYVLERKSEFHKWSVSQLEECRTRGPALISDIVYSEFSISMGSRKDTDAAVDRLALERVRGSRNALFRAGQAFVAYRRNGGKRNRILPDFIIGAIAADEGAPLMTANGADFQSYFPELKLITPK